MNIQFITNQEKRQKPDPQSLGFGNYFADYMFEMDYVAGQGWINPTIKPYQTICIEPSAMVLHYGQSVFEGLKAYLNKEGDITLFRPQQNIERLNKSCDRLCMPRLDEAFTLKALKETVKANSDWIPQESGSSLYIRPFVFATDEYLGVRASNRYKFMIIVSPVGAYYSEGFNPVQIYVEEHFVRAVRGGIGEAKAAGNYAASIKAQSQAKDQGFAQVLWLDGVEQKYIEEVGTMNVFFKINNEIVTPALSGSILAGITRDSSMQLLKDFGYTVSEKRISIDEIAAAHRDGTLEEVFGTGTAAIISPVGGIYYKNQLLKIKDGQVGEVSQKLFDTLTGIQRGELQDPHNWIIKL